MGKRIIDHAREESAGTARRFAEIERARAPEGGAPAARQAHRRPHKPSGRRTSEYVRIEKGEEA